MSQARKGLCSEQEIIFVIDDDISAREGIAELVESFGFTVQTYCSAEEFLHDAPQTSGCIILDVFMGKMSGLELQERLNTANIDLPIIFLTGHGDIPMTVHALRAGAAHFLTKPAQEGELLEALQEALASARVSHREKAELDDIRRRFQTLARREREVMAFVVSGCLNKQIAYEMGISERTVKLHRARVMQKMAVESFADLVKQAERIGIGDSRKNIQEHSRGKRSSAGT